MATMKEIAEFLDISLSGVKYKKRHKPKEYFLIELGYEVYKHTPSFNRIAYDAKLANQVKIAIKLKEK